MKKKIKDDAEQLAHADSTRSASDNHRVAHKGGKRTRPACQKKAIGIDAPVCRPCRKKEGWGQTIDLFARIFLLLIIGFQLADDMGLSGLALGVTAVVIAILLWYAIYSLVKKT